MLLSDPQVQKFLQDEVIPVWEMVRPVPKVTIDFGNGKKLERTLVGNTVMYICLPDGKAVDALPGIYIPRDFFSEIAGSMFYAKEVIKQSKTLTDVINWHTQLANLISSPEESVALMASKSGMQSTLLSRLKSGNSASKLDVLMSSMNEGPKGKDNYKKRFLDYCAKLRDISKEPHDSEEILSLANRANLIEKSSKEKGNSLVKVDSYQNTKFVRPAIHIYWASLGKLPTPAEAKLDIFKTILKVPVDDPYLGLADIEVPGSLTKSNPKP